MSLLFGIIEVEIEEQHGRIRLLAVLIEHILKYRRAENGLAAARDPVQPNERPPCGLPVSKLTALDEPRTCFWIAVFQRSVEVCRRIWSIKPLNDSQMLTGCVS